MRKDHPLFWTQHLLDNCEAYLEQRVRAAEHELHLANLALTCWKEDREKHERVLEDFYLPESSVIRESTLKKLFDAVKGDDSLPEWEGGVKESWKLSGGM